MDLSKIGVPFSAWVEKEFPLACGPTHGGTSVGALGQVPHEYKVEKCISFTAQSALSTAAECKLSGSVSLGIFYCDLKPAK